MSEAEAKPNVSEFLSALLEKEGREDLVEDLERLASEVDAKSAAVVTAQAQLRLVTAELSVAQAAHQTRQVQLLNERRKSLRGVSFATEPPKA